MPNPTYKFLGRTASTVNLTTEFGPIVSGYIYDNPEAPGVQDFLDILTSGPVMAVKYHTQYSQILENALSGPLSSIGEILTIDVSGLESGVSGLLLNVSGITSAGPSGLEYLGLLNFDNTALFSGVGPIDMDNLIPDLQIAGIATFDVVGINQTSKTLEYQGGSALVRQGDTIYLDGINDTVTVLPIRAKVDYAVQRLDTTLLNMDQAFQILADKMKIVESFIRTTQGAVEELYDGVHMDWAAELNSLASWPSGPSGVIIPDYDTSGPYTASGANLLGVPVNLRLQGNPFGQPYVGTLTHPGTFNITKATQTFLVHKFYASSLIVNFNKLNDARITKLIVKDLDCPVEFVYTDATVTLTRTTNSIAWSNYSLDNNGFSINMQFNMYQPVSSLFVTIQAERYYYTSAIGYYIGVNGGGNPGFVVFMAEPPAGPVALDDDIKLYFSNNGAQNDTRTVLANGLVGQNMYFSAYGGLAFGSLTGISVTLTIAETIENGPLLDYDTAVSQGWRCMVSGTYKTSQALFDVVGTLTASTVDQGIRSITILLPATTGGAEYKNSGDGPDYVVKFDTYVITDLNSGGYGNNAAPSSQATIDHIAFTEPWTA